MTAEWMHQYPSTSLTRSHKGDKEYAVTFRGEADKLLYQLKNLMKFRNLGQLKMVRVFTDGTVITAKSHFGYDIVNIDVSKAVPILAVIKETCTITFVYLNEYVPPMRYSGEVRTGEEDGIDYVKTYYSFDKSDCPSCADEVEWEFTFDYATDEQIDYYDAEPNNHCVASQDGGCSGEVIEKGVDEVGTYIIWKVYTEASNHNRSGLGYAKFHAALKNRNTQEIVCEVSEIIGVDCCEKDVALRLIEIWWEEISPGGSILYAGLTLYRVPTTLTAAELDDYIADNKSFYALTEDENGGGCIPFEWTLTGYGTLIEPGEYKQVVTIAVEDEPRDCLEETILKVNDRCGTLDLFEATPCCDTPTNVYIEYTSIQMSINEEQTLIAHGGCGPYRWSLSGGGSLSATEGVSIIYTAPSNNPNCVNNPTITLTDCCGDSHEVKFAVNGYLVNWNQFAMSIKYLSNGTCVVGSHPSCTPNNTWAHGIGSLHSIRYNCRGDIIGDCTEGINFDKCNAECGAAYFLPDTYCGYCVCPGSQDVGGFDILLDLRILAGILALGCCPVNPITGQPM